MAVNMKNFTVTLQAIIHHYKWWEWSMFIIGFLAFVSVVIIIFFPLGSGPSTFTKTADVPPVSDKEFVNMLSSSLNLPIRQGSQITVINNGDAFLKSFLQDIDNAQKSINIMTYIWTDGKMSDQVLEHLDQKLKQGVEVRIIVDAYGSKFNLPKKQFDTFKQLGGKMTLFRSLTIVPWEFIKNQSRNHRRAMVIDGNIAYTGGITISDPWLGNAQNPQEYRDMMFRTTGPMAQDIQGAFAQIWTSMMGEFLVGEKFFQTPEVAGKDAVLQYIPLSSIPSPDSLTLQKLILLSMYAAQKKIYITNPYFLPDKSFRAALIEKAKQGVDVRILVPNKYNDAPSLRYASHYWYEGLMQGGVKIYEYDPTFIHAKTIIVDDEWSIIGSANMDNRSRKINAEDIFGVKSQAFGESLDSIFMADLAKSKQIDLAEWKKRSLWDRSREILDQKFVQQY